MKNLFYLAVFVLFTASCTKDEPEPYVNPVSTIAKEFTVQPNEWVAIGQPGQTGYGFVAEKSFPELTEQFFNDYVVFAFYHEKTNNVKFQLPLILTRGEYEIIMSFAYYTGNIGFTIRDTDLYTLPFPNTVVFKAYIIKTALIDPGKKYTEEEIKALSAL